MSTTMLFEQGQSADYVYNISKEKKKEEGEDRYEKVDVTTDLPCASQTVELRQRIKCVVPA